MQSVANKLGEEIWPRIAPLLDSAVANLSESDREAIALRYYEGKTLREVGAALSASEDAAEKRVARALDKLRAFFVKRGITVGASGLAIVAKLAKGAAQSITQLTEGAGVTRQAITKHLRVLEAAGLVRREPIGREMLFLLEPEPLVALQDYLERVSKQWDAALARLKVHVER